MTHSIPDEHVTSVAPATTHSRCNKDGWLFPIEQRGVKADFSFGPDLGQAGAPGRYGKQLLESGWHGLLYQIGQFEGSML
jgi:hypothetical protein